MRRALAYGLVAGLYFLASAENIDLMVGGADLGRHLRNGEGILSGAAAPLLHTNYYSYTQPEFPFVNHHWLSGVVYHSLWKAFGFTGLHAIHLAFGATALLMFFRIAEREAGLGVASALALLLMPILRARASVRPEVFSFLLAGVFLTLLWRRSTRSLFVLPPLMALWVNLH
ncbi:MAG: hypothetical protein ACRD8O_07640, partial [Bryobacteraceae bacterium]